jgi:hypothetical protein
MNMHATIMDFANSFPFWDSLDSVRRIHSDLEGFALVFFALLVVSETLVHLSEDKKREKLFDTLGIIFFAVAVLAEISAYPYGKRDDTLSGQVIDSLDAKASERNRAMLQIKRERLILRHQMPLISLAAHVQRPIHSSAI